jgi:hypothetical protein
MRNKTMFISVKDFKDYNAIDENVNDKICSNSIWSAQRKYIELILSSSLYFDLMDKAFLGTLNADEDFMIREYLQPALAEYSFHEFTLKNTFQSKAIGLVQGTEDNSNTITLKDIRSYQNGLLNEAEKTGNRLLEYIKCNSSKFPKYNDMSDPNSDMIGAKKTYFSGMYNPKNYRRKDDDYYNNHWYKDC